MVAYLAASEASAPPKRGLPLAAIVPPRNSSATSVAGAVSTVGVDDQATDWTEAVSPSSLAVTAGDEGGPSLEDLEAQMGREIAAKDVDQPVQKKNARTTSGPADETEGRANLGPLPELDVLLNRLPTELRESVEELLRVRFTAVKRVPGEALASIRERKS